MKIERNKWLIVVLIPCIVGITMFIQPPVFYLNDDVTMRSILSGAYTGTPDGHAVYMQYPLTGILALLYRICGSLPWLELFFTACVVTGMSLVALQFKQPIIGMLVSVVVYMPFYLYMHYTLIAALMGATAVFLVMRGKHKVWSLVFVAVAYMIRSQVGLLCLPFVACAWVWQIVIRPKAEWKKEVLEALKWLGCLSVVLFLSAVIHSLCYSSEEWKSYLAYNDSRTLLYDYTNFLSTDYYAGNFASFGMTEEEYMVLSSYNTMLDSGIDEVKMQQVAEAVAAGMKQNVGFGQQIKECVQKYYVQIRYNDVPYNYVWVAAYLLLAVGFVLCRKWLPLLILTALGTGRSAVWMYLLWKGRFPERVSLSLYVIELMLLLGMGLYLTTLSNRFQEKRIRIASWILIAVLVLACGYEWKATDAKVQERVEIQAGWDTLKGYCAKEEERLYLVDVFSVVEYADHAYAKDAENIMLMGGWMSAGPLAEEVFAGFGAKDAAEALYYCDEVSLIAATDRDMLWLEEYLQECFGACELVAVGDITWRGGKGFTEYVIRTEAE